jgi:hypothetical protein
MSDPGLALRMMWLHRPGGSPETADIPRYGADPDAPAADFVEFEEPGITEDIKVEAVDGSAFIVEEDLKGAFTESPRPVFEAGTGQPDHLDGLVLSFPAAKQAASENQGLNPFDLRQGGDPVHIAHRQ